LLSADDQASIQAVSRILSKTSQNNFKYVFDDHETAEEVLKRAGDRIKEKYAGAAKVPKISFFSHKPGFQLEEFPMTIAPIPSSSDARIKVVQENDALRARNSSLQAQLHGTNKGFANQKSYGKHECRSFRKRSKV
jgi:hypothetical protein